MTKNFAQLDIDNICIGIITINSLEINISEYNYTTDTKFDPISGKRVAVEPEFISRMIEIPVNSEDFIGLKYDDGNWKEI